MNKVFILLEVPLIGEKYEVYIPIGKQISKVAQLLSKDVYELSGGHYPLKNNPCIYSKISGQVYDSNLTVKDTDIRNGSEIILM